MERVTEEVLAAEGSPVTPAEAGRVWVQIREIPDGGVPTEKGERAREAYEQTREAAPV